MKNKKNKSPIICLCNFITQETIEKAISEGADSLSDIYDKTTAGTGPCGGSCRPTIIKMIKYYLENKRFHPNPKAVKKNRRF